MPPLLMALVMSSLLVAKNNNSIFVDTQLTGFSTYNLQAAKNTFHLFSHGKPGSLLIDGKWLNAEEIVERFKSDLSGKSEFLIYGCNFGSGDKGKSAVHYLEQKLNLKVSASENITGTDGDWVLEYGKSKNVLQPNFNGNLQLDNIHYLQPLIAGGYNSGTTIQNEYVYLSTPSSTNITVTVTNASGVGSPRMSVLDIETNTSTIVTSGSITFSNATPKRITFVNASNATLVPGTSPITRPTNTAGTIISGNTGGLIFQSTDDFYVNYRADSTSQAGSVLTKGTAALGKNFRWGGTPTELSCSVADIGNTMTVTATEDNTVVTISNIDSGTEFINGGGTMTGTSFIRNLNKGESFVLYAPVKVSNQSVQDYGWLGAKVVSDKDIAVTVGGLMQQGQAAGSRDIAMDQLVPVKELGNEYIVAQGNGGSNERVIVVATQANTRVFINGNGTPTYTLANDGDYAIIPSSNFVSKNMFIEVDKAAYVFHKIYGGTGNNTNSFMFIPPLSCFGEREVNLIPDANKIGTTAYGNTELVVLSAQSSPAPTVTVHGTTISPTSGPTTVPGNIYWVTYRYNNISSSGGSNPKNVHVTSTGTIQAELIGASGAAGFGGFFSGFGTSPVIGLTVINSPLPEPCTGDSGNSSMYMDVPFDPAYTYQWFKNGVAIPGANNHTYYIPTSDVDPAEYQCVIFVAGGCTIYSNMLTTVSCPCSRTPATGTGETTNIGVSTRVQHGSSNWPTDIPNGFITLESNDKGLVITRMTDPEISIPNPIDGMLVYDTDDNCLKLYDGTEWYCIESRCN